MGWITKAFLRGMLIGIPVIAAVIAFGSGKQRVDYIFEKYDPLLLVGFVFLIIWLGIANVLAVGFIRRKVNKTEYGDKP